MPAPTDYETFDLGDFTVQSGATLRGASLAYQTWGRLNADRSNAIIVPTWYSAWHTENEWMVGSDKALDPERYFIISPNMLNNGLSSSPSNTRQPYNAARFPPITFVDQVNAQHKLITERFGISTVELVTGSSMGGAQTYQWAVSHPEVVKRAAPIVGSPRTSEHNQVFLKSLAATLRADAKFADGWYAADDLPTTGLRAFARVYAGWGFSQAFYWRQEYRDLGFSSLEDFLVGFWERHFLDDRDPNNLLGMLWTWQHGDVGNTPGFGGDTEAALRSIRCPLIDLPCRTDLYFPPEDEEHWCRFVADGQVRVIPSSYGHFAGLGINATDNAFIDDHLRELLSR